MKKYSNVQNLLGTAAVVLALGGAASVASAQEVTLRSNDGSATIRGTLLEFADGFYRVETELGTLRLSASRMICEGDGCPELGAVDADLTFAGSATMADGIMPLLISGYAYSKGAEADVQNGPEPGTAVAELVSDGGFGDPIGTYLVKSTGSSDAFTALRDKTAQVGMSSRRILPAEARMIRDAGGGNMIDVRQERIVAVDPVTVVVHPSNPVGKLTLEQLGGIFNGSITNWSEVGGMDAPIAVHALDDGIATRDFFDGRVLGDTPLTASATLGADDNAVAAAVNSDPNAVGYVSYAFQRGAKPLALARACGITSTPSPFTAKAEEYPLDRRLYLYTRADSLSDTVEEFFRFAASEDADGVIAKAGFVDLGIVRVTQDSTGGRMRDLIENTTDPYELTLMRDMLVEMLNWDRLSTTLRFASGSRELDERGRIDLARLIDYLAEQPDGTEVALVGFTDSDGAFEGNRALAVQRAQQVAAEVRDAANGRVDHVQFSAMGFGELSPAACNDTADGKRVNRRVEIWIRGGDTSQVASN